MSCRAQAQELSLSVEHDPLMMRRADYLMRLVPLRVPMEETLLPPARNTFLNPKPLVPSIAVEAANFPSARVQRAPSTFL